MKAKLLDFLENKSQHLMTFCIVIQGVLFALFTALFILEENTQHDFRYKIYICGSMCIFFVFMIHFAYHSIAKAYFIELISFLLMSTISSILFIYNFYRYVITKHESPLYSVIGITSIVLLLIGNIIHFISAYFSYGYFQLKFFEKLGAKEILHKIFSWIQFNNSMFKADFGFILIFLMSSYVFDYNNYVFIILDTAVAMILFINIYIMRSALRTENKLKTILVVLARLLLEGYKLYRFFSHSFDMDSEELPEELFQQYKGCIFIILGVGVLDEIILILMIVSTFMCISNFGKGLKEMLIKQEEVNNKNTSSTQLAELC